MALVIAFVPDPDAAVVELRRVTKSGGTVATYMWDMHNAGFPQHPLRAALEKMGVSVPFLPGHTHSRMEKMQEYFHAAGLTDIVSRAIEIDITYADFDEFWSAQTALPNYIVQHIRKLPAAEVEQLKSDLRTSLPKDNGGRIAYKARANAVKGHVPA
jgi:ubiquinone/menaquinone biosynthesis C-methylase UbiE